MKVKRILCGMVCLIYLCALSGCSGSQELQASSGLVSSDLTISELLASSELESDMTSSEQIAKTSSATSSAASAQKTEQTKPKPSRTQTTTPAPSQQTSSKAAAQTTPKPAEEKVYGIGETWVVDNQWELTFTAVTRHEFCNNVHDSTNYKECIILTYSYKNIGRLDDVHFASAYFKVFDAEGEAARTYPCIHLNYPTSCPVGMKCTGAQEAYEIKNTGEYITISVSGYATVDGSYKEEKATFRLKVTDNNSPNNKFPSDVKTYQDFPYAPDFGAMLGIDYDVVNRESDLTSYAYLVSSVMAADDDGSSGADYIDLLEKCGYKDKGTLLIDGVTFYKYENSQYNTTVEFGISDSLNATIVTVF